MLWVLASSVALALPATSRVLERSLPGVVLLLRHNADGTVGYGAGVIVGDQGLILTNLHVVGNATWLGAMFWEEGRRSYIPEDGGLARYVFENREDIVPVELVRGDPRLDLALVRAAADTSRYPHLRLAERAGVRGEPVFALGHPQETVWSFTTGVVSSLHEGVIQTDAAINRGKSGGPLLDRKGRVLGINTSKLLGGTDGIAFARPIALARELIGSDEPAASIDRSQPRQAFENCQRASDLGVAGASACLDWRGLRVEIIAGALEELRAAGATASEIENASWKLDSHPSLAPDALAARLAAALAEAPSAETRLLASSFGGVALSTSLAPDLTETLVFSEPPDAPPASWDPGLLASNGLKVDPTNSRSLAELMRLGVRVADLRDADPSRVWLLIEGRNLDGSVWKVPQLMVAGDGGWQMSITPTASDLSVLPGGWPEPLSTADTVREALRARTEVHVP